MMFVMRLPLQTRYTILSEGCSCPTMPNDDENVFFDSPRLVRAVISLTETRGQSMASPWHNVLSLRHVQQSPVCYKHPHTSGHNTACSIRCNTKWRPNHRAPKLLVVLLRVAYFSVAESACCVSTFQLLTVVATYLAQFPLFLKACVRYACGFSCFGWICWTCRGADRACGPELVLPGLPFTKSKPFHNYLF